MGRKYEPNVPRECTPKQKAFVREYLIDTTAKNVKGTGGKQVVKYDKVKSQYLRVVMSKSSKCFTGGYSVAEFRIYDGNNRIKPGKEGRVLASGSLTASKLDDIGLAYDFTELKAKLKAILERFDHTTLNDIPPFDKINPSSENIASTIYEELKTALKEAPVKLDAVAVWESPESGVEYGEG